MRWSGITEANMRIECEVCGAQHHLADKKIPSKAFKIRCRGCGRFIIERPESAVAKTAAVAAPVATAVATRPAPAASEAASARLTAQRNDNSVLFSLENLLGMGAMPAAATAGGAGVRKLGDEGSGLNDIRTIRAMIDQRESSRRRDAAPVADPMPSFAGDGLGGLSITPVPVTPPTTATTRAAAPDHPRGLYALVGLLMSGLFALGAVVILDDEPPEIRTQYVLAEPAAAVAEQAAEVDGEDPAPTADAEQASAPEAKVEDAPAPTEKPRTRTRSRNRDKDPSETKSPTVAAVTPGESKKDDITVDCLLDKSKCKDAPKSDKVADKSPGKTPKPTTTEARPAKLESAQILAGITPVKTAAKSCGSGTTVAVKFSVEGATGKVLSAQALDEHAASATGKCVVAAAKKAHFDTFSASQQGFTFKFRL